MLNLVKQYKKELRNILLLVLVAALLPYLPKTFHFLESFTGMMMIMGVLCGCVLGLSLKLHYRIMVLRINKENNQ
ncbi:MAG TPA: hypothetical protein VFS25_10510 [Chitinophaga sp.]|uniref:hypothetical protein n=1 Tax=Chitinophaga sp. TaxID=1869181 RepID=UPI002DBCE8AC|nr:hypothetical protein [Chitinophaga sp.]HEU4553258.1 hypothetical protein [Chitinophaga sp.]